MTSFTIGKKLFLGVGALVTLTFALGLTAFLSISSIGNNLQNIVERTMRKQTLAHELALDNSQLLSFERGIDLRGFMKDVPAIEKYHAAFSTTADEMQKDMDIMAPLLVMPEARQALQELNENLTRIRVGEQALYKGAIAAASKIAAPAEVGAGKSAAPAAVSTASTDMEAATAAYTTLLPLHDAQTSSVSTLLKVQGELVARDTQAAETSIESNRWINGVLLALSVLVALVTIFVVRQINQVLRKGVLELTEASEQIASAAHQVSSSSQSLAQGSSQQAATIEETSSASAEINSMAQRNTENSRTTADLVTSSQAGIEKTNLSLSEMVGAMDGISASSTKISKIIKVIDEIAFQTNILALNAAVEAARAGEAGMGFAVVADEVRNLAQRCAQAAKDTADLIEDSIQKSDGGKAKVDQVALAIREITGESSKIKVLVDEINLGSVEQSRGIDQISRSITQMEQVTQGSAASAEQTASAAEELSAQAQTLKDVVSRIKIMVNGEAVHSQGRTNHSSRSAFKNPPYKSVPVRAAVASFKSTVAFPRTKTALAPRTTPVAVAAADFPMDGDFKEF
jgi:methyl-accepting chemotaxis protein